MPSETGEEMARERAALIGITVITALLGTFVASVLFVAPVPLALLIYRHSLRSGIITALAAGSLAGLFMGSPAAMVLVLLVLGIGVAIGEALRDGLSLNQILSVSWGVAFLSFIGLYVAARVLFGIDLISETAQMWFDQLEKVARSPGGMALPYEEMTAFINRMRTVMPGMMAVTAAGISVADYWLTGRWLMRIGVQIPWFAPFARWRFPWYVSLGYLAGLGLPMLQDKVRIPWLAALGANLELVFYFVFLIEGMAVLWFYIMRWNIRKWVGLALETIAVFFAPLIIAVGLLDSWLDLRRLRLRR